MKDNQQMDSVIKRYAVTLASNVILFFAGFVTAGIVPRALGPKQLGDFSFLSRIAGSFRSMLDMGSSSAFFNYNAKHSETGPMVKVYGIWMMAQLLSILALIVTACAIGLQGLIWPGQQFKFILWIAILDWAVFLASSLRQLSDSKGYTTRAQVINLFISLANIIVLVVLAFNNALEFNLYVAVQLIASALISLLIIVKVILPNKDLFITGSFKGRLGEYKKYFVNFCSPLVAIMVIGFIFEYFDRMVLQIFSGSVQQGYFHLASSWSAVSMIFTASVLSIYKREVTSSLGQGDGLRASRIFSRYVKLMYFITLSLAAFLAFNAKALLFLMVGPKFDAALAVIVIMAFYPIHQVYGQLGGAIFYSAENTRLLRNISVVAMLAGIPMTYIFLAPANSAIPGLGLGSVGLALKTVIWNFLLVQVYLVYNCRFLKIRPGQFWRHQAYSLIMICAIMALFKYIATFFIKGSGVDTMILRIGIEAALYFGSLAAIFFIFPNIGGLNREEVRSVIGKVKHKIGFGR